MDCFFGFFAGWEPFFTFFGRFLMVFTDFFGFQAVFMRFLSLFAARGFGRFCGWARFGTGVFQSLEKTVTAPIRTGGTGGVDPLVGTR